MITNKQKRVIKNILTYFVVHFPLVLLAIFVIFPLAWVVSTSIKQVNEIMTIPPKWIPDHPTLLNYINVLTKSSIPRFFVNSVAVGLIAALVSVIVGGITGYGLARYKSKTSSYMGIFILGSHMLPVVVIMIPMYLVISNLQLYDTILGLALVHLVITLPLVTWMCKGYFETIPIELEEAAQIEGCNRLQALAMVVLPIAAPGIAASGMYAFVQSWNEFTLASILTESVKSRTLPIGITEFANIARVDWGSTMAAAIIVSLPVIIIFFVIQKYIVSGLSQGAVKG